MSWKDARIGYQRDIHQSSPYILFMLINTEKIITTIYVGRPVSSQGGGIRTSRLQLLFRTLAITIVTAYMGYLTYVHGRVLVSSRKYAIQSKLSPIKYKLSCTSEHGMIYTHTHGRKCICNQGGGRVETQKFNNCQNAFITITLLLL